MTRLEPSRVTWRKSPFSDSKTQDCVEVAWVDWLVAVRDSKNPDGPVLTFTPATWHGFLTGIRTDGFSPATGCR